MFPVEQNRRPIEQLPLTAIDRSDLECIKRLNTDRPRGTDARPIALAPQFKNLKDSHEQSPTTLRRTQIWGLSSLADITAVRRAYVLI